MANPLAEEDGSLRTLDEDCEKLGPVDPTEKNRELADPSASALLHMAKRYQLSDIEHVEPIDLSNAGTCTKPLSGHGTRYVRSSRHGQMWSQKTKQFAGR